MSPVRSPGALTDDEDDEASSECLQQQTGGNDAYARGKSAESTNHSTIEEILTTNVLGRGPSPITLKRVMARGEPSRQAIQHPLSGPAPRGSLLVTTAARFRSVAALASAGTFAMARLIVGMPSRAGGGTKNLALRVNRIGLIYFAGAFRTRTLHCCCHLTIA